MKPSLRPLVVAHRGNPEGFPDNSLAGVRSAVELGVDLVEVDVRLSRDGVPVLYHDAEVLREGRRVPVSKLEARELERLSLKEGFEEGVPTLRSALEITRGRCLVNLDVKDPSAILPMVQTVQEMGVRFEVVVSGCTESWAARVRAVDPTLPIFLNADDAIERALQQSPLEMARLAVRRAVRAGLRGVNFPHRLMFPELIRAAHTHAVAVWTWTVDQPERMRELIRSGVDAITTNRPALLLTVRDEEFR